jgi:cathepsin L
MDNTSYIMIKNSWGSDWGMDCYIYFSTMIDNMCGIATAASYPIV